MGKLKSRLTELEDEGIIYWSEDLECFVLVGGDPTKPFELGDYNEPMPTEKVKGTFIPFVKKE